MSTQESNKLIAEFMGWKCAGIERRGIWPWCKKEPFYSHPAYSIKVWGNFFKYDRDWNYLMAVIQTISRIKWNPDDDYETFTYPVTFGMRREDDGYYMFRFVCGSLFCEKRLITAAYKAVIDWIEWYNSQQSNTTP